MHWEDAREPRDRFFHYLCSFCGSHHEEKDLLEWQVQHLSDIETEKLRYVIRNIYKYFKLQLTLLQQSNNEHFSSLQKKEDSS